MIYRYILLLSFYSLLSAISTAQPYHFRHYEVESGLSNNTVIAVLQDKYGFIWLGTGEGLNRFDGNDFKVYRHVPGDPRSLKSNSIYCLHEDGSGNLWVGTEKGISQYDPEADNFRSVIPVPDKTVRSICSDNNGTLWFILKNELYYYNLHSRIVKKKYLPGIAQISVLSKDLDGDIWMGTPDGRIARLKDNYISIYNIAEKSSSSIEAILNYDKDKLLIGSSKEGLIYFDIPGKKRSAIINEHNTGKEIFVRNILQVSDSSFFISTEEGLFLYTPRNKKYIHLTKEATNPFSLSDNALYALCKDREGGIWIGSYFGGVNYLPKVALAFDKYFSTPLANSLAGNAVREITKDRYGNLWIGSEDGGLTKYNTSEKLFTKYAPNAVNRLSSSNIHGLLAVENQLLVGTFEHGIDIMDIKSGKVTRNYSAGSGPYQLKSNFINKIFRTSDNTLLICTAQGIYRFDIQKGLFHLLKDLPADAFYSAITEDQNGTVWIGTHNRGLFYLNKSGSGIFSINTGKNNKLSDTRILYLMEDADRSLWVCTIDGLYQISLKDSTYAYYNKAKGLPSDVAYSIVQDNFNNYWIPTSQGLAQLDHKSRQIKVFRQYNGILNDQFNYQSVYKDTNGDIYLGSIKGLIRFNPSLFHNKTYIPPVYITTLQHPGVNLQPDSTDKSKRSLINTRHLQLPYNQATFNIEFAALSFTEPVNIMYAYKVNNSGWYQVGNMRKIAFTNLSPGSYVITIRSTNGAGRWMPNARTITIRILPPWWKSGTAYFLYSITGFLLLALFIKFFDKRQKEKQRYKMDLFVLNKEKELYQAKMDFFTNITHEIKTPLTLIKVPLETISKSADEIPQFQKHLQIMNSNAERLFELTNQLLDFRKTETEHYQLYFSQTDINKIVADTWNRFIPAMEQKRIKHRLVAGAHPVIIWGDEDALTKILSNLIDNAIKYCDTEIILQLEGPVQQNVKIVVMNDGPVVPSESRDKIFDPFIRLHTKNTPGSGIGLPLARSLTELHKGALVYTATNNFNTFELTLPYTTNPIKSKDS